MRTVVLALADRRRARVKSDPFVDVGVFRLRALGIRFFVQLLADGAEVTEEHREQDSQRWRRARSRSRACALVYLKRVRGVGGGRPRTFSFTAPADGARTDAAASP